MFATAPRLSLRSGLSILAVTTIGGFAAAQAAAHDDVITIEPLTERHAFTDDVSVELTLGVEGLEERRVEIDDASRVTVFQFSVAPGGWFPWHTHPGTAIAAVTEGELVYIYAEDCVERSYPAGTAFVDPGFGSVHTAYNPSDEEETVVVATFLNAPEEGPLTIHVEAEEAAAFDAACDIAR